MKAKRGRWAVMTTGALVLLVAALLALEWREVAVRYHIWRLDRALTQEEAMPWLEALARDSAGPGMSESIIRKLGPSHQNFTFWLFWTIERLANWQNTGQDYTPLAREACRRMERDEPLLARWAHYLRWRKDPLLESCVQAFQDGAKRSGGITWFGPDNWESNIVASAIEERGRFIPKGNGDPPGGPIPIPQAPFPAWSGPLPALEEESTGTIYPVSRGSPDVKGQ